MGIENIMYFALGLLAAGLVALLIMPAVWRRAVRLTKKRIEAATPITMAEFRADKDQLRAEFALSTRRLEMNVEALRRRLSDQLRDINRKRTEVGAIKSERDNQLAADARARRARSRAPPPHSRPREGRRRPRASACACATANMPTRSPSSRRAREALRGKTPRSIDVDGKALSGDYNTDMDVLLGKLEAERKRAGFLENQNRSLISQVESADKRHADAAAAAAELRASLAKKDDAATDRQNELIDAEARIADAENRVNIALADTAKVVEEVDGQREHLLAEKLAIEDELEQPAHQGADRRGDGDGRLGHRPHRAVASARKAQRHRLAKSAASSTPSKARPPDSDETAARARPEILRRSHRRSSRPSPSPSRAPEPVGQGSAVSDRLAALRDLQSRN